jgi:hypothetical protein
VRQAIERQARLGLLLAFSAAGCTSDNASGGPSDSSADVTALQADASDAGVFSSATGDDACTSTVSVQAASFDQSCVSDSDCVAVGQGNGCAQCAFVCPSAAINKGASAAYHAAALDAAGTLTGMCNCPDYGSPCCHQGQCTLNCDDEITDVDACATAGGTCVPYAAVLDGGLSCVRISYCTTSPTLPGSTISICCPAPIADGGAD